MTKHSLFFLIVFTLSTLALAAAETVTVTQSIPRSAKAGSSFTIELTINKAAINGFAKLQTILPEGFTATVLESKTASFSFRDQKANFIWLNLPTEPEFKISYRVNVAENAPGGSKNIDSKFSYLENNEKKMFQVPILSIMVESSVAGEQAVTDNTNKPATTTTPAQKPAAPANNTVVDNAGNVKCIRTIKPNPANPREFLVDVFINKGDIAKFAKLEESIPPGFFASGVQVAGGVFSAVDQKAKILWMALPPYPEFTITYKLVTNPDVTGKFEISGVFAYLQNDQTKKSTVPPSSISVGLGEEPITAAAPSTTENTEKTNTNTNNPRLAGQQTPNSNSGNTNTPNTNQQAGNKETAKTTGGQTTTSQQQTVANNANNKPTTQPSSTGNTNNPRLTNQTPPSNNSSANTNQNSGSSPAIANNTEKPKPTNNTTTTKPTNNTGTAKTSSVKEPATKTAKATVMPAKSSGISYKVQVAATHKNVRKTYFQQKFNLQEPFSVETHEGWYKYTVNSFTDYRAARSHRDNIQKNTRINGPFVVAYNDGKRITVQEALMISKQKWFK